MKQIGAEIGVNESRVSQLHARAIQRLHKALGADCSMEEAAQALRPAILSFQQTMKRLKMARTAGAGARGPDARRRAALQGRAAKAPSAASRRSRAMAAQVSEAVARWSARYVSSGVVGVGDLPR